MTPEQWSRLKSLFDAALRVDVAKRRQFIESVCDGDADLESNLNSLIAHHEAATSLLEGPLLSRHRLDEYLEAGLRTFQAGDQVAGRFRIERFIGEGGMGEVYAAEDLELHERVALKTLRPALSERVALVEQFKQEIHLARRVTHRNVARVFELFREEIEVDATRRSIAFLTMELLDGETLSARIRRAGPMSVGEALPIAEQIASGLEAAHSADIVHRDLKSSNILLIDEPGGGVRAAVSDFGLAGPVSAGGDGSSEGPAGGTLAYAAPEQLRGASVDRAADIYSFGVVLFEMVTGKLPFPGEQRLEMVRGGVELRPPSPRRFMPGLDPAWESAILRCLQEDPAKRPSTPAEVLRGLRPVPPLRRRLLVGSLAVTILAGAGIWYWQRPPRPLNSEAVKSFKRGEEFAHRRNAEGLENAVIEFRRAVALEPSYADAWVGLSDSYSAMANFGFRVPKTALAQARDAADHALQLRPRSGAALGALGYVTSLDVERWLNAEPYFRRALAEDPRNPTIRLWYGAHLGKLGRSQEALEQLKTGLEQAPSSLVLNQQLAVEYFRQRNWQACFEQARELVRLQPFEASSYLALARALERLHRYDEAMAVCDQASKYGNSPTYLCFRGVVEAARGHRAAARQLATEVRGYWDKQPFQAMLLASLYAQLGDRSNAVDLLNAGFERGDSTVLTAPTNPYMEGLDGDPSYRRFLDRIGWPRRP